MIAVQDRLGTEVARYRLDSVIGHGGMGVVYRATDLDLHREVALKLMAPELTLDNSFRERFVMEAELIPLLEHPHVVPVFESGSANGELFIAMGLVEGKNLKDVVSEQGSLSVARTVRICSQVAHALDQAHEMGIVHRDVKPQNILLVTDGGKDHAYLSDFGLVKEIGSGSQFSNTGHFMGTIHYASPEQITGGRVDGRADVYSLGCTVYECLTGRVPFERDSGFSVLWAHVKDDAPLVSSARPRISSLVDEVVARAMSKSPEDRFLTCGEFLSALQNATGIDARAVPSAGALGSPGLPSELKRVWREPPGVRSSPLRPRQKRDLMKPLSTIAAAALIAGALYTGDQPVSTPAGTELVSEAESGLKPVSDGRANLATDSRKGDRGPSPSEPTFEDVYGPRLETDPQVASHASVQRPAVDRSQRRPVGRVLRPAAGTYVFAQSGHERMCRTAGGGCLAGEDLPTRSSMSVSDMETSASPTLLSRWRFSSRFGTDTLITHRSEDSRLTRVVLRFHGWEGIADAAVADLLPSTPLEWLRFPLTATASWRSEWISDTATGILTVRTRKGDRMRIAGRAIETIKVVREIDFDGSMPGSLVLTEWVDPQRGSVVLAAGSVRITVSDEHFYELNFQSFLRTGPGY